MREVITLNPADHNLIVENGFGPIHVIEHSYEPPDNRTVFSSTIDAEGARPVGGKPGLRPSPNVKLLVDHDDPAELNALIQRVEGVVGDVQRRHTGVYRRELPNGEVINFDLVDAKIEWERHNLLAAGTAICTINFQAQPYGYGNEVELGSDTIEATNPVLVKTIANVPGTAPALGRLVVDNDAVYDQSFVAWGLRATHYDAATTAALYWEARDLTLLNGGSLFSSGNSTGTGFVRSGNLTTDYQGIVSTQRASDSAHMTHVGTYNVWMRAKAENLSDVGDEHQITAAFEWSEGDFTSVTRNTPVAWGEPEGLAGGEWVMVRLGQVVLSEATQGDQRWEGRVIAKTSDPAATTDQIDIDFLALIPVDDAGGELYAVTDDDAAPTTYVAFDQFTGTTSGGVLNGRTPPKGLAWVTTGGATDFTFSDNPSAETITRATVSDAAGREAVTGSLTQTDTRVQVDLYTTVFPNSQVSNQHMGVYARYADTNNYIRAYVSLNAGTGVNPSLVIARRVGGGAIVNIKTMSITRSLFAAATWFTLDLQVLNSGRIEAVLYNRDTGEEIKRLITFDSTVVSGGALAAGKVGIYDANNNSTAATRYYDNFKAWSPLRDAVIFGGQSLEIRHDDLIRESSDGTTRGKVRRPESDYLQIPPVSAADIIVQSSRLEELRDDTQRTNIDDLSARLFITPRYLTVPAA